MSQKCLVSRAKRKILCKIWAFLALAGDRVGMARHQSLSIASDRHQVRFRRIFLPFEGDLYLETPAKQLKSLEPVLAIVPNAF
jgi:hypothetical protein